MSFANIKELIENNRTTLRRIEFVNLYLSPDSLLSILEMEGLKLRRAIFPLHCYASSIKKLCEIQPSLTSFDLRFKSEVSNDIACIVCQCLPNLELTIEGNLIIDNCYIEVFQLQQLVKLNLKYCINISELSYQKVLSNLQSFKLKHLNLEFTTISDESF